MKYLKIRFLVLLTILAFSSCNQEEQKKTAFNSDNMIIRIAEIEIIPEYLDEYILILEEESEASVRLEAGVISIFPMFQKEKPNEIRILEIYADKEAYESHLLTPHFKYYKTATVKMVKSLNLIGMRAIDEKSFSNIFIKLEQ